MSALKGQADIAFGNVVGSNIFNVLFILGVSALIAPLIVAQRLIWIDVPIMIGTSVLVYFFALNGRIDRLEGILLAAGLVGFTFFTIFKSQKEDKEIREEYTTEFGEKSDRKTTSLISCVVFIVLALGLLVLGTRWFVDGAIVMARMLGVSELIIGLTIVAAGTSMPEVFASLIATRRGELDIAVGNVVGSNIFNILGVLGISSFISPGGVHVAPEGMAFDVPVMVAVAVACLPIFFTKHRISRWEGVVFLFYYIAYVGFLIMNASKHDSLPLISFTMSWFVIPLTVLTVGLSVYRSLRRA
jgi:cation:H+ antiporter